MRSSRQPMFGTARPSRAGRLRQVAQALVGLVVVALVLGGVSALLLWRQAAGTIQRAAIPAVQDAADGAREDGLVNVLVTTAPTFDDPTSSAVVVQVGSGRLEPVALAFPPALKVEVPGRGAHRLDGVRALGGTDLLVRVVEDYAGVDVDHLVEVSIEGTVEFVDRVGGVELCDAATCREIDAPRARELLMNAEGQDALGLVRQQVDVLAAVAGRAHAGARIWDPLGYRRVIKGVGAAARFDDGLGVRALAGLAETIADHGAQDLDLRVIPGFLSAQTGYVHAHPEETAALLQSLASGTPMPAEVGVQAPDDLEAGDVRVMVLNGEGTAGLASLVADRLAGAGFVVAGTENNTTFEVERTFIRTTSADEPRARLLAEFLGVEVEVIARLSFTNVHVELVVGADRAGVPADAESSSEAPA